MVIIFKFRTRTPGVGHGYITCFRTQFLNQNFTIAILSSSAHPMSRAQSSGNSFSSVSSLTSVSSVREEPFKEHVRDIKTGPTALETLVEHATFLIDKLAANEEKDTYQGGSTVQLHAVLRAMLVHADGCSGKQGTRYTAAAIWACVVQDDTESADTLQMLHDLAETWALISYSFVSASDMPMIYLSYIVKFNRSHSAQQNRTPSEAATPSRDLTAMSMDRGVTSKARPASFKDQASSHISHKSYYFAYEAFGT